MKLIDQSWSWEWKPDPKEALTRIERAARTCYKSEEKMSEITPEQSEEFLSGIMGRGHHSVIEHSDASVKIITNRGVTHELVRHRLAAYSQQSTRYVGSCEKPVVNVRSEADVIDLYLDGWSMKKISDRSPWSEWEIYKILENNKIQRRSKGNHGVVYHDFFDIIDMPEKAYLLGLIMADGSVHKNMQTISITQHKDVSWYINTMIKKFIFPNSNRWPDKNCHTIGFTSQNIARSLVDKGIIPNKTNLFTNEHANLLWNSIPNELIPSFLRGFLDGDGSVRFFRQKNRSETFSCNITWNGSYVLLQKIQQWLSSAFNYKANILDVHGCDTLKRISITQPDIGLECCKDMIKGFKFPFGNPNKTQRMCEYINMSMNSAFWGDDKFEVILPVWCKKPTVPMWIWCESMDNDEQVYTELRRLGWPPQQAREVLPNALKTEIIMSANFREWNHVFNLRCSKGAHPQMRTLMLSILKEFVDLYHPIFDDVALKYKSDLKMENNI